MFNNSPALYINICSTHVQILDDLSMWTLSYASLKSEDM